MNIVSYIHPTRTYLPCTGVGRHINNMLLSLNEREGVELSLLFSQQWFGKDGKLDIRCPLRTLPVQTFPMLENRTERLWKLFGFPQMDQYVPLGTNWLYAPMETYLPVSKCPVAVTLHDVQAFETTLPWSQSWQHRWFQFKWELWVRRALDKCRVVFTVSEFSKQRMIDLLDADPRKLVVVGNGVSPSFFEIASVDPATLTRPVEAPYVLVIGGLRQWKGAQDTLAVADALDKLKSYLQIVVVGASEPTQVVAAQVHPNVHLMGMVGDEELPALVRGAVALLFLSPYEGFGMPAIEAMAAGVPVVVANRAALPEVVGQAGIIIEPNAAIQIADILCELENNSALRTEHVCKGRQHARHYTWSQCVDRVLAAFQQFA